MSTFVKPALAVTALALGVSADHYVDNRNQIHLRMNPDKHFKIMQLTDLHFGEQTHKDHRTQKIIQELIAKENPDFIVVTGDVVSGQAWDGETHGFWAANHLKMVEAIGAKPYGMIAGFHDYEADLTSFKMLERDMQSNMSVAMHNEVHIEHGFTYQLNIENAGDPNEVQARLWMFGTGRAGCLGADGFACVERQGIEWFKSKSAEIDQNDIYRNNGMAFMHNALQEHMHLGSQYPHHGSRRDYPSCQALNTGLFAEFRAAGNVSWVSAGGDHSTDIWGDYAGINLAYGRKSGAGSYGPKFVQRGARMFDLSIEDGGEMSVKTWIRQEDGSIDEQIDLNDPPIFSWLDRGACSGSDGDLNSQWIPLTNI